MDIELKELKAGDYLINNQILVERKAAEDFFRNVVARLSAN